MKLVDFNPDKPKPSEIDRWYRMSKACVDNYFDKNNPEYEGRFLFKTEEEINRQHQDELDELSLKASFFVMTYIESLFRTDFVLRLESGSGKWKDQLTRHFKYEVYVPTKKMYQYSLVEDIISSWKIYSYPTKGMMDILNTLPQYFDFRNWMAHGRYWIFKEDNYQRKYNYEQMVIMLGKIEREFENKLKTNNFGMGA